MQIQRFFVIVGLAALCMSCEPQLPQPAGAQLPPAVVPPKQSDESFAFVACESILRLLAKNPSSARIPKVESAATNGDVFVFDWTRRSGLSYQNNHGAMIDSTASCASNKLSVVSLVFDDELINDERIKDLEREAGMPSKIESSVFTKTGKTSHASWIEISSAVREARVQSIIYRKAYYNDGTKGWAKRRFFVGPVRIRLGEEADQFDCKDARASLDFRLFIAQSPFFDRQELAEQHVAPIDKFPNDFEISLSYCRTNERWLYLGGKYKYGDYKSDLYNDEIDSIPIAGLFTFTQASNEGN